MSDDDEYKVYQEDSRIPCRYGVKCYQKNPVHHEKYKHPPRKDSKGGKKVKRTVGKKRKSPDTKDENTLRDSPEKKVQKRSSESPDKDSDNVSVSSDTNNAMCNDKVSKDMQAMSEETQDPDAKDPQESADTISVMSLLKDCNIDNQNETLSKTDAQTVISALFLTEMPEDFYKFYDLCETMSTEDPFLAFKDVRLKLVGPYDVLRKKFLQSKVNSKEDFLRHWRYYYDPPEFQTIIKCDGKNGLHFGYWRDDTSEKPAFVAKNEANLTCLIVPVAGNIFGAIDAYIEDKVKSANPFEKTRIIRMQQQLRNYAKENQITLEKKTSNMQQREKKVVARTFHKAGIVVPYDRKTQLGYRELAVMDRDLRKILDQIKEATSADEKKAPMSKLEEVIRLATIAADECDFGTCLELGHDLFCSGISQVQNKALQMLSIAYTHLQRPQLLEIFKAHLKDRKKGADLSVL